jgi:hypothetical protein
MGMDSLSRWVFGLMGIYLWKISQAAFIPAADEYRIMCGALILYSDLVRYSWIQQLHSISLVGRAV